ncbi:hypothetical protein [Roseococcus sp. YIM B11640]|uniref:hypothetical protein n=1 Tax=Roseococcus sp. YIM B11640 TaxID=3133973 RepID=UPI003C7AD8F8
MAANMRGPKRVDPLYMRWDDILKVSCTSCARSASAPVSCWAEGWRLSDRLRLDDLMQKLYCSECGGRRLAFDLVQQEGPTGRGEARLASCTPRSVITLVCEPCGRRCQFRREMLVKRFGIGAGMSAIRLALFADCPRIRSINEACGATYEDPLPWARR